MGKKKMSLKNRLGRLIDEAECDGPFDSFMELCEALSNTRWATELHYDKAEIGNLICKNDIETLTDIEPVVTDTVEKPLEKRGRGRPKGSKNQSEKESAIDSELKSRTIKLKIASVTPEDKKQHPSGIRFIRIATPAGKCPVALKDIDQVSVERWAEGLRQVGLENSRWYTKNSLKYWVRDFHEIGSPECQAVFKILDSLYVEEMVG